MRTEILVEKLIHRRKLGRSDYNTTAPTNTHTPELTLSLGSSPSFSPSSGSTPEQVNYNRHGKGSTCLSFHSSKIKSLQKWCPCDLSCLVQLRDYQLHPEPLP
eukprot:764786-Hanusia_phi.AAC.5